MKSNLVFLVLAVQLIACTNPSNQGEESSQEVESQDYTGPIIDVHIHAYTPESAPEMFGFDYPNPLKNENYKGVSSAEEQMEETFKRFERYNIVKAVTSDGHLWYDANPETIMISGRNKPIDELRKDFEAGRLQAIGELAPFYGGITADHPSQQPLFDLAEELDTPVGFHIYPGGPPGAIYRAGMPEVRVANADPKQIEEVLVSHPNMRIYIMHGGWPYLEDMKAMMYAHPQLYIDVAVINWALPKVEFHQFLEGLVNAGFGKRIMFGSDQMTWPGTIDIGIEAVNSAEFLSMQQKEDIFYNNAVDFLRLSEEEVSKHKE